MTAPSVSRSAGVLQSRHAVAGILTCLGGAVLCLGVGPVLMPDSYSWVSHTTSESAAQGVEGAWLTRLGFVLSGLAVLWLVAVSGQMWNKQARILHAWFGVFMVATAAFSARSWEAEMPFDATEDVLHSIAATGMVFAFTLGVVVVLMQRVRDGSKPHLLDVIAVAAALLVSVGMAMWSDGAGLLQRAILLIVFVWYAAEVIALGRLRRLWDVSVELTGLADQHEPQTDTT